MTKLSIAQSLKVAASALLLFTAFTSVPSVAQSDNSTEKAEKPAKTEETTADLPASMIPTENTPNAPSLAVVEGHRKLSVNDWENPEVCGSCHTVQYQGWKGSMHANAFKDPLFQAEWALAEKEVGGNISKLCAGCHTPPGMLSDSVKFDPTIGEHGGFTAPPIAQQGVSCDVCHTMKGTTVQNSLTGEHGNGSFIVDPGQTKRASLKNSESPYHDTEYSEHHTQAAFCGNCHNIFNPVNNFPLERTYDEWKYSVYAQNNVQCQDCHMVPVEIAMRVADELKPVKELENNGLGGKAAIGAKTERDVVHGHGFVGGNAVITAALGDPDSQRHAEIAVKRLRSAAAIEVKLDNPKDQGALHNLEVKVINKRAGHHIPTSLTFIREIWLEIEVTDQDGKVLYNNGQLDDHHEIPENATRFQARAVDKDGKPAKFIWTVARFEHRNTIPPKGHQYGRYAFIVPEGTKELHVQTRLNYRSASQHFVDHLLGKETVQVPVVNMNNIKTVFNVSDLTIASSEDLNAQTDAEKEAARILEAYDKPKAAAQDIGKLTKACATCHGADGQGIGPDNPNIGGQNEQYLLSALRAYQNGTRQNDTMSAMLTDLSDQQLQELATYYTKMSKDYKAE